MATLITRGTDVIRRVGASWQRAQDRRREEEFIRHNRRVWGGTVAADTAREILVEQFSLPTAIMAQSYFVNLLAGRFRARIRAYWPDRKGRKTTERLKAVYRSFNAESFEIEMTPALEAESERLLKEVLPRLQTKRDVEELRLEGVLIGDLVYDSHLMNNRVPTVDLASDSFRASLKAALDYFVFWRDYLDSHDVASVIVSHCVYYEFATVLRLAIARGIPSYQVNSTHVFRLSEKDLWAYTDFRYYPEEFKKLPPEEQKQALELSKERLDKRVHGEVGVDMPYSKKSAYARTERKRVLAESDRPKLLIATHCFFDSPHGYGINLFPDFYEWLEFLGTISEKTEYDWYIKTHPDYLPGTMEIVRGFVEKYPRLTLLPPETSHLQLIEDGLDFALSVYGSIGCEYAVLGKTVINASPCNPHVAYHFNLNPCTVEEYEQILTHLPDPNRPILLREVYEYYYLRYLEIDNWLYDDYHRFIKEVGGSKGQSQPVSYTKFLEECSAQKHTKILSSLERFIDSDDFVLRRRHLAPTGGRA